MCGGPGEDVEIQRIRRRSSNRHPRPIEAGELGEERHPKMSIEGGLGDGRRGAEERHQEEAGAIVPSIPAVQSTHRAGKTFLAISSQGSLEHATSGVLVSALCLHPSETHAAYSQVHVIDFAVTDEEASVTI